MHDAYKASDNREILEESEISDGLKHRVNQQKIIIT